MKTNVSIGSVSPEIEAARLFDDAILVAGQLNEFGCVSEGDELEPRMHRQLRDLHDRASALEGMNVVYSGFGFVPMSDPNGEVVTVYSHVNLARGRLSRIYITDTEDLEYIKPEDVSIEDEDLVHSSIDLLDHSDLNILSFRERLKKAPAGLRLFTEFLVHKEVDVDAPIRGHAVRAAEYAVYNVMDAASLEVFFIDQNQREGDPIEQYLIGDALKSFSDHYRKQLQNKNFRNGSLANQQEAVNTYLERCNELLQLDRFMLMTGAGIVFVPSGTGFETCIAPKAFPAKCLRFDCVESVLLNQGNPIRKRRGNFNSLASACVVVEIDDVVKQTFELDTNILWVPLTNQLDDMQFMEQGIL